MKLVMKQSTSKKFDKGTEGLKQMKFEQIKIGTITDMELREQNLRNTAEYMHENQGDEDEKEQNYEELQKMEQSGNFGSE